MSFVNIISQFSFAFDAGKNPIINNLNLKLESDSEPTRVGLIGSNGVGKSTILNSLWESSFEKDQRVEFDNQKIYFTQDIPELDFNPRDLDQNFYQLLLTQFLSQNEDFENKNNYFDWLLEQNNRLIQNFQYKFGELLLAFELVPSNLPPSFNLLSPGTAKKYLLALALATEPNLVLVDELTNHLDKEAILVLIEKIKNSNTAWLIVDHNQKFLSEITNQFVWIPNDQKRNPIHFKGKYEDFLDFLDARQNKEGQDFERTLNLQKKLQKQQHEVNLLAQKYSESVGIAQMKRAINRKLQEVKKSEILTNIDIKKNVSFQTSIKQPIKRDLIARINPESPLIFKIGTEKTEFLDLHIHNGEKWRISGQNGSGKSTLIKSLLHQIEYKNLDNFSQYISGSWILGDLDSSQVWSLLQITKYPEEIDLFYYLGQMLNFQSYQISTFLKKLELQKFNEFSKLNYLSLGEFIRIQIGILAQKIQEIKLIILDEPGNYLDIFTQKSLVKFLENYKGSLILVTHDDFLAEQIGYTFQWSTNKSKKIF